MRKMFFGGGALAIALVLGAPTVAGQAAKAPGAMGAKAAKIDVKAETAALESNVPARIEAAIQDTRAAGRENGRVMVQPLVGRLRDGLPRELLRKALDVLGELEDAGAAEAGVIYMAHRDPDVRLAAVRCLAGSKGPVATRALREALTDPDPRVHSMAAVHLGATKAPEAVPDLVIALDKGVSSAAVSIGMLCDAKSCNALLERLKSKPFDVISSGLQQVLNRREIADDYKKKVITALRELASQRAREFLQEIRKSWPPNGSKAVAEALDKAIKDLEGASK